MLSARTASPRTALATHAHMSRDSNIMAAPAPLNTPTSTELAQRAAAILLEHKANDVVLLSLAGVSDMTDFFLIASGTSDTHVRSLGNSVLEEMKKQTGQMAHHVEGLSQGRWVLLDYVDFVVHVFHPTLRNFYQIERLWADAETIPILAPR
jgi:ribosome-associated protein